MEVQVVLCLTYGQNRNALHQTDHICGQPSTSCLNYLLSLLKLFALYFVKSVIRITRILFSFDKRAFKTLDNFESAQNVVCSIRI